MIPFIQTTLDGLMVGCSYGLLALGFALIFGVMRRLNLSYGPSIMIGAYLGTLLYIQVRRAGISRGDRRGRRLGDGRDLCRAALLCSARRRRGRCLDGFELRHLDAARTGEPADAAASQLSVPVADRRRTLVAGTVCGASRLPHHAGRDAGDHRLLSICCSIAPGSASGCARSSRTASLRVFPGSTSSARCSRPLRWRRRSAASPAFSCCRPISRSRRCSGCGRR